jgi:hypothetical protein
MEFKGEKLLEKLCKWVDNVIMNIKFEKEDNLAYNYVMFLFFKLYAVVFSYTIDKNDYKLFLFGKCYEIVKNISNRESYEVLNSFYESCEDIFKLRKYEIKNEIDRLNTILYEF